MRGGIARYWRYRQMARAVYRENPAGFPIAPLPGSVLIEPYPVEPMYGRKETQWWLVSSVWRDGIPKQRWTATTLREALEWAAENVEKLGAYD